MLTVVEVGTLGEAFLDVSGTEGMFGNDQALAKRLHSEVASRTGFSPKVGLASSKFTARVAAELALERPKVVRPGWEKEFLAPLPAWLLPVSEETKRRLTLLGLTTLGQIQALPLEAMVAQFGREGELMHRLASGIDERPLVPRPKAEILEGGLCLKGPATTLRELLLAVELLSKGLLEELKQSNRVCRQVKLCFGLANGDCWEVTFTLKEPTTSQDVILTAIRQRLEGVSFAAAVEEVNLALMGLCGEEGRQAFLFTERARREQELGKVEEQLRARYGQGCLKRVAFIDRDSRIPERRAALVDL